MQRRSHLTFEVKQKSIPSLVKFSGDSEETELTCNIRLFISCVLSSVLFVYLQPASKQM